MRSNGSLKNFVSSSRAPISESSKTYTCRPIPRKFFAGTTPEVAQALIGKCLWMRQKHGQSRIVITETEAYCGQGDPASHAYQGPTPRTQVMFEKPGVAYVYFIYGRYHCLNVVTEPKGVSGAVLIRAGIDIDRGVWINGPGRLCKYLGIDLKFNRQDLIRNVVFTLAELEPGFDFEIRQGPRIGISKGTNLMYRFYVEGPSSRS